MQIIGYIGYAILIFMTATWMLGIRLKPELGIHTIMGAFFFFASTLILWLLDINKLHAWWILPSGFLFMYLCIQILVHEVILLSGMIKIIASIFSSILRIGIPKDQILAAQQADAKRLVDEYVKSRNGKF